MQIPDVHPMQRLWLGLKLFFGNCFRRRLVVDFQFNSTSWRRCHLKDDETADDELSCWASREMSFKIYGIRNFEFPQSKSSGITKTNAGVCTCWFTLWSWEDLNVIVQKNVTITLEESSGFDEKNYVHIPWDTIWQLYKLKPDVILS